MRELETSLQQFGEFILKARLVKEHAAPYCVRWVRRFLARPAADEPLADQVRRFCEELEQNGDCQDWQVRQAEQALRIYFLNFLQRTDWHRQPRSTVVDKHGRTGPLPALEQMRSRIRTRHYSYRTEVSYVDWARRFLAYVAEQQAVPHPLVESGSVRDYLTHLAVRQRVSASTQNQALCAILFLCREVLGVNVENLSGTARAKRGSHLPVVLSLPETAALLEAMRGTTWLMAALIYGGGLRVSECCELRRTHPSPLLRDAPAARRCGYQADPGVPGARQRRDDDGVHPRRQRTPQPGAKSSRYPSRPIGQARNEGISVTDRGVSRTGWRLLDESPYPKAILAGHIA